MIVPSLASALTVTTHCRVSAAGGRPDFGEAFPTVRALIDEFGEPGFADRVMSAAPEETDWRPLSDLLGIAIWLTSDNGHEITQTARRWLQAHSDQRKVLVALNLDVIPVDATEIGLLQEVAERFPTAEGACRELIAQLAAGR